MIQWDDPFEFTSTPTVGPSVGKFQAWIYNAVADFRPEATFEYAALGALPATATIGIENILGDQATALVGAGNPGTVLIGAGHDLPRLRRSGARSDHRRLQRHRRH